MKKEVKTPWYDSYDSIREHLDYPDVSLYHTIEDACERFPNNVAYNYFGRKVKYKEFYKQIDKCAKALKSSGVKYKDIVTICMPNTPEAIIAFYALNKIGAISNIIHPLSAENEIKKYLLNVNCKYFICLDSVYDKVKGIIRDTYVKKTIVVTPSNSMPIIKRKLYEVKIGYKTEVRYTNKVISWNDFIKTSKKYDKELKDNFKSTDIATILYSGGTTGVPKGIVHDNLSFIALAKSCVEFCQPLDDKDSLLAVLPMFHGFGLEVCIHTPLSIGACVILVPKFDQSKFGLMIKKYKPSVIVGVPTLFEALLNTKNLKNVDLSFIRCILSGGDVLQPKLKRKVDNFLKNHKCKTSVREGYGLTECLAAVCISLLNTYKKNCIGIPCSDVYVKIVKPDTEEEIEYNEEGEIVISGPSIMLSYINNQNETKKTIRKHSDGRVWLYSGDLGYMDDKGFVYFKQRIKRMIISSGYNVYPTYIESIIDELDEIKKSCVIGIPHPYKMEVAKAYLVLEDKTLDHNKVIEKVKKHCEKNLAKYSIPYEFEIIDDLPKTNIGKVDYKKLEKLNEKE